MKAYRERGGVTPFLTSTLGRDVVEFIAPPVKNPVLIE
jgi:hypothetical protein